MRPRLVFQIVLFGLFVLIFVSAIAAFASDMEVSDSDVGFISVMVSANDLKPNACSALNLTAIIRGSGMITGTNSNDLIFGSSSADVIDGMGGTDCILSSAGDDNIEGGDETDVCLGGDGVDMFANCEITVQ
jgi:Ca2+-binding RTX toxin-like protein